MSFASSVRWIRARRDNRGASLGCGTKSQPCLCVGLQRFCRSDTVSALSPVSFSFSSAAHEYSCSLKLFLNNALQVLCCPPSTLSTNNVLALCQELNFIHICKNIKTKHTQIKQLPELAPGRLREAFPFPLSHGGYIALLLDFPLIAPSLIPSGLEMIFSRLWVPKTSLAYNCRDILRQCCGLTLASN